MRLSCYVVSWLLDSFINIYQLLHEFSVNIAQRNRTFQIHIMKTSILFSVAFAAFCSATPTPNPYDLSSDIAVRSDLNPRFTGVVSVILGTSKVNLAGNNDPVNFGSYIYGELYTLLTEKCLDNIPADMCRILEQRKLPSGVTLEVVSSMLGMDETIRKTVIRLMIGTLAGVLEAQSNSQNKFVSDRVRVQVNTNIYMDIAIGGKVESGYDCEGTVQSVTAKTDGDLMSEYAAAWHADKKDISLSVRCCTNRGEICFQPL